jgi:glycine/D-amino acid oxidase-like deaminating enzyme
MSLESLPSDLPPCDVLVVGAGAVGITMAVALARAGQKVLLIEGGPAEPPVDWQNATRAAAMAVRSWGWWKGGCRRWAAPRGCGAGNWCPLARAIFSPMRRWASRAGRSPIRISRAGCRWPMICWAFRLKGAIRRVCGSAPPGAGRRWAMI